MTKKEAIKLFEEKKVRAMMEYKVSAGNKLKRRLTQIIVGYFNYIFINNL